MCLPQYIPQINGKYYVIAINYEKQNQHCEVKHNNKELHKHNNCMNIKGTITD